MLQCSEGLAMRSIQIILYFTLISVASVLSADPVSQGYGDGQQQSLNMGEITVVTGSEEVSYPAIWGNYVVWKGAVNEIYAIDQNAIVPMPGLKIDGVPAIWENIVVWEGVEYYYDLETQTRMPMWLPSSVGDNPAISNRKIVWDNSIGYFDIDLDTMVYAKDLTVGDSPDIDDDRIVWSGSEGYYDIQKHRMVQPRGLDVGLDPAIHRQRITWSYLKGAYYDLDLESFGHARIITGQCPDIFGEQILWLGGLMASRGRVAVWEQTCGTQVVTGRPSFQNRSQIYGNLVVRDDAGGLGDRLYISQAPSLGPTIEVTTRLDKTVYAIDETIEIDITAVNRGSEELALEFPSSCEVSFRVDGIYYSSETDWCLLDTRRVTLAPNAPHTWQAKYTLSTQRYPSVVFMPGTHSITGVINGYAESSIVEFEVVAE